MAQRLLEADEQVVDCQPSSLLGSGSSTPATTARPTTATLRVLRVDSQLEALRMLCDRREELPRLHVRPVDRLQGLLAELVPGKAEKDNSPAGQGDFLELD